MRRLAGGDFRARVPETSRDEFGELARWCREALDAVADAADLDRLREPFLVSSRFELAFWDMARRLEQPLLDR